MMKKTTFFRGIFLMACCLAVAGLALAQTKEFTTTVYSDGSNDGETSTWTVPDGVNTISIIAIGGGGGGGAVCPSFSGSGIRGCAGGGGGAYVKVNNYTVNPGDVLTVHVGSRGSGSQSCGSTHRGWGGDSWVKIGSTTIALAKGASDVADGAVNEPGTGGQASQCIGDEKYSGGNGGKGSTGAWCGSGGGGAAGGGNGGNGAPADFWGIILTGTNPGTAGTTSRAYAGNGGAGTVSSELVSNTGHAGGNYGGGGGGGATDIGWVDADGGDGGPGYVLITYSVSCDATAGAIAATIWECGTTDTSIVINNTTFATSTITGSYMWQYSADGSTWNNISGADASYHTAEVTGYYRRGYVVGTCPIVFTSSVQVTRPSDINPGTLADASNQTSMAVCSGSDVSVSLTATSDYSDLTWQTSTDQVTWTSVSSVSPLTITGITQTTYVRFVVNYSATCNIPSNNIYTITVKPLPVVLIEGANPYNVAKCANKEITVSVTGADAYEWENHSTANPATFPATSNGSYVVTGTTDGCSSTATITITNNPLPTIDVVTASTAYQEITYGDAITNVVFTTTASSGVEVSTLPAGLTYTASTKTISGTPTAQGTYTITATATSSYGCDAATKVITIKVGKKALTITYTGTGDNQKVYDGDTLELSYDKLTINGLVGTDQITSGVIKTDGYKAGTYVCNAGSFERMWADGTATPSGFGPTSVTQNYSVTFNVTLTITKRLLEITAKGATKEYDATPLTPPDPGYEFTGGTSLAPTDEAEITVTGSQLCPGSSNSTVTNVVITHQPDNENVNDSYTITKKQGLLTVTPMVCPTTLDYDGYTYPIVQIGEQCWFAENLRAAAPDAVPYDEESSNEAKFGLLYNWSDALAGNSTISNDPCYGDFVRGKCPDGWAIPSAADFDVLKTTAGDMKALRSNNAEYWVSEYIGTNTTGFDERGGGLFNASTNRFEELKSAAYFWTSESVLHSASFGDGVAHSYCDEYYCGEFIPKTITVESKLSIRCVRKTVPGATACTSLGSVSLDYNPSINYLKVTMPINNYNPSMVGYADVYAYYGGSNHLIATTSYGTAEFTTDGVLTAIIDASDPVFSVTGPVTISLKVDHDCALDGVEWSESVKLHD